MEKDPYFKEKFSLISFENKRWLSAALACIAGATLLVTYVQFSPGPEAFAMAEEAVLKWETSPDKESFENMQRALKKVPSLEKKYEPVIAQKLFETGQIPDALGFAHRSLSRIEKDVPFHAAYGETSLLIEQGAYQIALEKSVGLKEEMAQVCDWTRLNQEQLVGGSLLYAHNLLRIAFLQQELQNKPGEKAAWEELEQFLQKQERLAPLVLGNFREKGLDLANYIAERKKQL